jgi:hypothetical protein
MRGRKTNSERCTQTDEAVNRFRRSDHFLLDYRGRHQVGGRASVRQIRRWRMNNRSRCFGLSRPIGERFMKDRLEKVFSLAESLDLDRAKLLNSLNEMGELLLNIERRNVDLEFPKYSIARQPFCIVL